MWSWRDGMILRDHSWCGNDPVSITDCCRVSDMSLRNDAVYGHPLNLYIRCYHVLL